VVIHRYRDSATHNPSDSARPSQLDRLRARSLLFLIGKWVRISKEQLRFTAAVMKPATLSLGHV